MKLFYLILFGTLCFLPMKANSPEFADRHPMAIKGEMQTSPTKNANIRKVTEEAKDRLLNTPSKISEHPAGFSVEGEWYNIIRLKGQILIEKKGNSARKVVI